MDSTTDFDDLHEDSLTAKRHLSMLESYLSLYLMSASDYIIGLKEKKLPRSLYRKIDLLKRIDKRSREDLAASLQEHYEEANLLGGTSLVYEVTKEIQRLLNKYPEGHIVSSYFSSEAQEIPIKVCEENKIMKIDSIIEFKKQLSDKLPI